MVTKLHIVMLGLAACGREAAPEGPVEAPFSEAPVAIDAAAPLPSDNRFAAESDPLLRQLGERIAELAVPGTTGEVHLAIEALERWARPGARIRLEACDRRPSAEDPFRDAFVSVVNAALEIPGEERRHALLLLAKALRHPTNTESDIAYGVTIAERVLVDHLLRRPVDDTALPELVELAPEPDVVVRMARAEKRCALVRAKRELNDPEVVRWARAQREFFRLPAAVDLQAEEMAALVSFCDESIRRLATAQTAVDVHKVSSELLRELTFRPKAAIVNRLGCDGLVATRAAEDAEEYAARLERHLGK